jgi:penicillin-binding protein 1A
MSAVSRFLRRFAIALLFVVAAGSGTVAGVLVVYTSDLPQISALDDYAPSTITRVYAAGGEVVGEFATQRRIVITYDQIPWGHGTYGVEAASRLYFGKSAKDVTLEEAALLAGIIQAPARHSPYVSLQNAMRRRNYALGQMADAGFITRARAEQAMKTPIVTVGRPALETDAAFFVEEVRQQLEERYGAQQLYENGLAVYTTLDLKLQHAAEAALAAGMRRIDRRHGFRKPVRIDADAIEHYTHPSWTAWTAKSGVPAVGSSVVAVVTGVDGPVVHVRAATLHGDLARADYAWTGKTTGAFLAAGDVVRVLVGSVDPAAQKFGGSLDQEPEFQGAVLAVQNRTGRVLAMVGGRSFELSRFNRTTQAMRQLGSTFKPIVYATAIDRGFTPVSILQDSPGSWSAGPGQPPYEPLNYDKKFEGPITLRHGLEESRNVPTVRLMESLGPNMVAAYAQKLGFTSKVQPYLSSALGSSEATLQEVVSAFAVFPNQGVRVTPFEIVRVADRQGNVLEENRPT